MTNNTIKVTHDRTTDRWIITVSKDGHRTTAIPIFDAAHEEECCPIAFAYEESGYTWLDKPKQIWQRKTPA